MERISLYLPTYFIQHQPYYEAMHCITMSVLLGQPYTQKAIMKNQQKIITLVESMQHFSFAQS